MILSGQAGNDGDGGEKKPGVICTVRYILSPTYQICFISPFILSLIKIPPYTIGFIIFQVKMIILPHTNISIILLGNVC